MGETYLFQYRIKLALLRHGFSLGVHGLIGDVNARDLVSTIYRVEVDGDYLVIEGRKSEKENNVIVVDAEDDVQCFTKDFD